MRTKAQRVLIFLSALAVSTGGPLSVVRSRYGTANAKRDRLGTLVKFVPPLVVAGRLYVPNYDDAVNVYGMLP